MKPNEFFSANPADTAAADANDSSVKRSGEAFIEEKTFSQKKNVQKDNAEIPAPYYDELHFANYE